jgi:hypothetical protein
MRRLSAIRLLTLFICLVACVRAAEPVAVTPAKPAVPNSDCMDCHEAEFKPLKKGEPAVWTGVRAEIFKKSVHGKLNCVDCHASITETPHPSKLPPAQCASCHAQPAAQYSREHSWHEP